MLDKLVLPKTLKEFSITNRGAYPISEWSGAVCILLVEDSLVFIKRSDSMPSHKGQIGFMGGHRENGEVEPVDTALRELQEEGNIQQSQVEVIGIIKPVYTSRNKTIIPVLCTFKGNKDDFFRDLKGNEEWNEMILTPSSYLMDPDNWQIAEIFADNHRFVGFCPLKTSESVLYPKNTQAEFLLWGASANMIWNLFNCYK